MYWYKATGIGRDGKLTRRFMYSAQEWDLVELLAMLSQAVDTKWQGETVERVELVGVSGLPPRGIDAILVDAGVIPAPAPDNMDDVRAFAAEYVASGK